MKRNQAAVYLDDEKGRYLFYTELKKPVGIIWKDGRHETARLPKPGELAVHQATYFCFFASHVWAAERKAKRLFGQTPKWLEGAQS